MPTIDPDRLAMLWRRSGWVAAALVPGALTLYLGFQSGGFYPGATGLAAAEMAALLALWFALSRRPLEGVSVGVVVVAVALGAFAAWTLVSAGWSDADSRALREYTRVLLYLFVFGLFGMLPFDSRRVRFMAYGLAAAIVVICAAAVVARTLPNLILDPALVDDDRLGYPLTYWNALGLVAAVGVVLCGHLTCSTRDPRAVRVVAAAAVPLLTLALYYTLSRGSTWTALGAVALYAVLGRPRALLSGALATAPAAFVVLIAANPANALTDGNPAGPAAVEAGEHVALVLAACMAGAAVARLALLPLDGWLAGVRLPERARRPLLGGATAAAIAAVLLAGMALNVPSVVSAKYDEFTASDSTFVGGGSSRLFSASSNGRQEHWDVAMAAYRRERLHGNGAGTYPLLWARERSGEVHVKDAHSLYVEALAELGLVGLSLLAVVIVVILGGFAFRARGPDRSLFAALLAAGLAWAIHAGIDWDWEMPAVTIWIFALGGATLARSPRQRNRSATGPGTIAVRVGGVAACLALAILPARVAISEARLNDAIDALFRGDCRSARAEAGSALDAVGERPTPYQLIAYCDMSERRYRSAAVAMQRALRRDPRNWELHYGLAVAQAAAGQDPRAAARRAATLNPNDSRSASAPVLFNGSNPQAWIRAGRSATLLPPAPGDP